MARQRDEIRSGAGKSGGARETVVAAKSGRWNKRNMPGQALAVQETRVAAVMAAAERSGLLHEKGGRIGGRISPALVRKAKAQTGIETDTDLIEFALANVALEDRFAEAFKSVRGSVDPDLDLGL